METGIGVVGDDGGGGDCRLHVSTAERIMTIFTEPRKSGGTEFSGTSHTNRTVK